jgi:hypothetical protein
MTELKVGDTFSQVRQCDKYRPIFYAAVSGDFNPIHIDPEVGRAAGLGGNILQGLCTLAWAVETVAQHVKDPGKSGKCACVFPHRWCLGTRSSSKGKSPRFKTGGRSPQCPPRISAGKTCSRSLLWK